MKAIPLANLPSQTVSFNADGAYWLVAVYQGFDMMYADISRDGAVIQQGIGCYVGVPLLQYPHQYLPSFGNFIFDSTPDWTMFGSECNLYYVDQPELIAFELTLLELQ